MKHSPRRINYTAVPHIYYNGGRWRVNMMAQTQRMSRTYVEDWNRAHRFVDKLNIRLIGADE